MPSRRPLPFFYGWVIVATAFVTMAVGVMTMKGYAISA
jgi:hypothetical protein